MTLTPYQSPNSVNEHESWWPKLLRLFTVPAATPELSFADGGKVMADGIAFYLDLADTGRLYAASPSSVHTDERLNLVVAEAIRVLPLLLRDNPDLQPHVHGRKLIVRLIGMYDDDSSTFAREYKLSGDYVSAVLDDTQDGG